VFISAAQSGLALTRYSRCGCIRPRANGGPAPLVAPRLRGSRAMCLDSSSFLPNTPCAQIQ